MFGFSWNGSLIFADVLVIGLFEPGGMLTLGPICTSESSELRRIDEIIIDKAANRSKLGTRTMKPALKIGSIPSGYDCATAKPNVASDPTEFS